MAKQIYIGYYYFISPMFFLFATFFAFITEFKELCISATRSHQKWYKKSERKRLNDI